MLKLLFACLFAMIAIPTLAQAKAPSREAVSAQCLGKEAIWRLHGPDVHPKYRLTEKGKCWYAMGKPVLRVVTKKKPVRLARATLPAPVIAAPVVEAPVAPHVVKTLSFRPVETFRPLDEGLMSPSEIVRFRWWK